MACGAYGLKTVTAHHFSWNSKDLCHAADVALSSLPNRREMFSAG